MPLQWYAFTRVTISTRPRPSPVHGNLMWITPGPFYLTGGVCGNAFVVGMMTEIIQTNFWTLASTFGELWQVSRKWCIRLQAGTGLTGISCCTLIGTLFGYYASPSTQCSLTPGTSTWIGACWGARSRVNMGLETNFITPAGSTIGV
jgi:hypothetical protein